MRRTVLGRLLITSALLASFVPGVTFAATVTLTADTSVKLPSDGSLYTRASGGSFDQLAPRRYR